MKKVLAVSGSLRAESINTTVLRQVESLVDGRAQLVFYNGYDALPHFNPDLDREPFPRAVTLFRQLVKEADAIVICTPEYAFGIPGSLKNALDWLVSSGELNEKPAALISVSPLPSGGANAMGALRLVCSALGLRIPAETCVEIGAVKSKTGSHGHITDAVTVEALRALVNALVGMLH